MIIIDKWRVAMRTLVVPNNFKFKIRDLCDFSNVLSFFDWNITDDIVTIDMMQCERASYQSMSLIILYSLFLSSKGIRVEFLNNSNYGMPMMWRKVGAKGLLCVARNRSDQFSCTFDKPLFFITRVQLQSATPAV